MSHLYILKFSMGFIICLHVQFFACFQIYEIHALEYIIMVKIAL